MRIDEPVDFDTGPFITQGLSPSTGKPVRYYNFDVQGTTPAPVYVSSLFNRSLFVSLANLTQSRPFCLQVLLKDQGFRQKTYPPFRRDGP